MEGKLAGSAISGFKMNQPKFKFGDKVEVRETKQVFTVRSMYWYQDSDQQECRYGERGIAAYESEIELFKEPQKKKLYAYGTFDSQIVFSKDEGIIPERGFSRESEYDIEYPEPK